MTLLATTALESTWGEQDEPVVLLGEWCRLYERSHTLQSRRHVVVRYHWDDRQKLRRDYQYLRQLHDELLHELSTALSTLHKIERTARFWQILLDPWLARYVAVLFDRWECLRIAFEEHEITHTVVLDRSLVPLRDQAEFLDAVMDDPWNHRLCSDILLNEYSGRCALYPCPDLPAAAEEPRVRLGARRSWKQTAANSLDRLASWFAVNNDYVFVRSYFPGAALLRLNLALRQVPRLYLREFDWADVGFSGGVSAGDAARASLTPKRRASNKFESFLHRRLGVDLPQVFVELFGAMQIRAANLGLRPKVILTAGEQDRNDLFKHWVAHRTQEGSAFVIMEHGGSLSPLFGSIYHEEEVADVRTTWSIPLHSRHVRLPANKFVGRRRRHRLADRLVVIGQEMPRYAYDVRSMPIAGQVLTCFDEVCRLHDTLDAAPQRAFLVKPYSNQGWSTRKRFVDRLGSDKVATEPRLERVMRRARIVVCTYPQTTVADALAFGALTVLVYPRHLYETVSEFDGLIAELRQAGMLFFDPMHAARHINAIWQNPLEWWNSAPVREACRRFEAEAVDLSQDWLGPWSRFVRGVGTSMEPGADGPPSGSRLRDASD